MGRERVNIEQVPVVPAAVGRRLLEDRNHRPAAAVVWAHPAAASRAAYLAVLERIDHDRIRLSALGQSPVVVRLVALPRPQGPIPRWLCPRCSRTCLVLVLFGLGPDDHPEPIISCSTCARLQYETRGRSRIRRSVLRALLRVGSGQRIPRFLLVPDVVTMDFPRLRKRFRNVSITPGPDPEPSLAVRLTL
jgi:hypothetical protein